MYVMIPKNENNIEGNEKLRLLRNGEKIIAQVKAYRMLLMLIPIFILTALLQIVKGYLKIICILLFILCWTIWLIYAIHSGKWLRKYHKYKKQYLKFIK